MQSAKCYNAIRLNNILTLPHPRYLQKLSSSLGSSPNSDNQTKHFLQSIFKNASLTDKFVNLQIDEIHVNEEMNYAQGQLVGQAYNSHGETAKTVIAFIVNCCFGHKKEIVKLILVKGVKGTELAEYTKSVMLLLRDCGLKVLVIITDNNRINRILMNILTKDSQSKFWFQIPNCANETFVSYNTVHLLKSVRNNWLNFKNANKNFYIPKIEDSGLLEAKFCDLENVHKRENNMLIKSAPKLSMKTIYPTTFERQKVSLVLNIYLMK